MVDRAISKECTAFLSGHPQRSARETLEALASSRYAELDPDRYGGGGATELLETRMAELTGRRARFVSKGMIAQMAALRVANDRAGRASAAVHPLSHFSRDEQGAVERLHGLALMRIGELSDPFAVRHLEALGEKPGAVSVELPLRNAGYKLTPWDELVAISGWCRTNQVHFHIDGARAWGAAVAYDKSIGEIAALADSIYLSFYKDFGGLYGCVLCGDEDFIDECDDWIARHGGQVFRQFPAAISALEGFDRHFGLMKDYVERARQIARLINDIPGAFTIPRVPHTNGFQIGIECMPDRAEQALDRLTRETLIWIAPGFYAMAREDQCCFDVEIGDGAAELDPAQWAAHIGRLVELSKMTSLGEAKDEPNGG
ncbi:MAG: threonine aldolase [Hyphomicrobiaceae bacterium]|nr:threonine aldolase [Hyphomicrobiaceae bacterium]